MDASIHHVLARLQNEADRVFQCFPPQRWVKVKGPGSEQVELTGNGAFNGMVWEPGKDIELRCNLTIPEQVGGLSLVGDPLEALISSLYPVSLSWNQGASVFAEDGAPVAAGPALVTVTPHLRTGDNGELHLRVSVPKNQTTQWFTLYFTTPRLRSRFELLDTAWAELKMAESLAVTQPEQNLVREAAALIPQNLRNFDSAQLLQVETALASLAPKAQELMVHVIGHSHIDMNWLWTWPDTVNVIMRDFKSVLGIMDDYPELTFSHSQPATYEVVRNQAPDLFSKMLDRIREGRWEPATMTWVEGDENMASGEALSRQILEAVSYSRDVLGFTPSTFLAPDTFGHPGNLPQLAVSAGAKCYYHHRCNPGAADQWPAYWWEGEDGTRLLALSTPSYNGGIRARDLVISALHGAMHGIKHSLLFHGVGDHGGGPARHNLDALRRLKHRPLLPYAFCSTLAAYTREILASATAIPVHRGELNKIFEGCYTTHADIKQFNRSGENLLCTADALTVMAGIDRKENLGEAWRTLLFNQFHDILDGSAIHESYEKSAEDFANVSRSANAVIKDSLQAISQRFQKGAVVVTNPLGWERASWVTLSDVQGEGNIGLVSDQGHHTIGQYSPAGLGFTARVPAFGCVPYRFSEDLPVDGDLSIEPAHAPGVESVFLNQNIPGKPPYFRIETPFFRVYLRRDSGIFTSFVDKRNQKELVSFGMRHASDYFDTARPDLALNVLQLLEEHPHPMSAWHMDEIYAEQSLINGAETSILECGRARIVLEVKHTLRSSQIDQQIIFYRDLPQVDFHMQIHWQELGNAKNGVPNLKIAFTADLNHASAWFEIPFAAVKRPCAGQEVPALRWVDVGGPDYGIALLNDCKYGFDVLGTRLRMTLLRSAYEPDAIADLGMHEFNFSFLPHPGDWRTAGVVRTALGFNQPLLACEATGDPSNEAAKLNWNPEVAGSPSIILAGLKLAKKGPGKVLRLYESAGCAGEIEVRGFSEGAQVWETNIVEDRLQIIPVNSGCAHLSFHPWQVRTLLVTG